MSAPRLAPFVCFYGGKYRVAHHYPTPRYGRIFEPCAGFAGYSMRHYMKDVVLVEADPVVAGVWRWLLGASEADVLALPRDVPHTVRDLDLAPGPSALVGFWLNKGSSSPRQTPSAWMRDERYRHQFWGERVRARIAGQVGAVRHWTLIEGDYSEAPDEEGTWFIDPTYRKAGSHYRVRIGDHATFGSWCRARRGQTIVCENVGADWLPFSPFRDIKAREGRGGGRVSREAIWLNESEASHVQ